MELKNKIIEATIDEFNEKSLKFTMDDVAKRLGISKKTIYTMFENKDTLFWEAVDYGFEEIKISEQKIIDDMNIDILEKIKRIIIVLPERYKNIDLRQVYLMKEKFPKVYQKIEHRIENQWEPTIELLEQAIKEGKIKDISIPILKSIVEATIEHFLSTKVLIDNDIKYDDALEEMVQILMDGIKVR